MVLILQRHFGVDAVAKRDAMTAILGGCENEVLQREQPGIEIHPTPDVVAEQVLKRIGLDFYRTQSCGIDKGPELQVTAMGLGPHLPVVIISIGKECKGALVQNRAVLGFKTSHNRVEQTFIFQQHPHDQGSGGEGSNPSHLTDLR